MGQHIGGPLRRVALGLHIAKATQLPVGRIAIGGAIDTQQKWAHDP